MSAEPNTIASTPALNRGPPPDAGMDLDPARRPGVPALHDPHPLPNSRFPPERQAGQPSVPRHGRTHKPMPPVFGTAVPLRGLSGVVKRAAYRYPDHMLRHWTLLLLSDRVDAWEYRAARISRVVAPLGLAAGVVLVGLRLLGRR